MGTVSVDVKYNVSRQSDMSCVRWRSVWDKGRESGFCSMLGRLYLESLGHVVSIVL